MTFFYITPAGVHTLNYEFSPWNTKHILYTFHNSTELKGYWNIFQTKLEYVPGDSKLSFSISSIQIKLYKMENGAKIEIIHCAQESDSRND